MHFLVVLQLLVCHNHFFCMSPGQRVGHGLKYIWLKQVTWHSKKLPLCCGGGDASISGRLTDRPSERTSRGMALPYGVIATIVVVQWLHWYFWQPTARWREDEVGAKISSIVWWSRVKSSQLCAPSPKYVYILPCSWATVLHEQITRRCFTLRQRPR